VIDKAFKFISDEINNYLKSKLSFPDSIKIVLDNIARLQDSLGGGGSVNKIILSLVNIEEDRLSKNPDNFYKTDDNKVVYKNAPIHLNLYCLFSYNHGENDSETTNHYEEALMYISYVVRFFQHRNVFTASNSPALDPGIEKLLMELNTLGFEQLNHLWAVLGGKYLPSVLYKMRLVVIDEDLQSGVGELIKNVNVIDN
jgi:Pvc16 N-terminal domain